MNNPIYFQPIEKCVDFDCNPNVGNVGKIAMKKKLLTGISSFIIIL